MDELLSEEELKRVYAIRDQYIEGEAPIIITSLFKGPFKTTPWIVHSNSNDNNNNNNDNNSDKETHLNDNTIGTMDSEKTIPYDTSDIVKTPSFEENATIAIATSPNIKKEE